MIRPAKLAAFILYPVIPAEAGTQVMSMLLA